MITTSKRWPAAAASRSAVERRRARRPPPSASCASSRASPRGSAGWSRCRRRRARAARARRAGLAPRRAAAVGRRPIEAGGEVERAAAADLALDPDAAAHQLDEPRRDRQPEAGAAVPARRRAVGLRERLEDRRAACRAGCRCRCRSPRSAARRDPRRRSASRRATRTTTSPRSVNFTALPTRFSRTWRSRPGSPSTRLGHVGADVARELEPLLAGAQRQQRRRVADDLAHVERRPFQLEPPRLDLREVEDVVDDRRAAPRPTTSRCRGSRAARPTASCPAPATSCRESR